MSSLSPDDRPSCGWCGFTAIGGDVQVDEDGTTYCHGPGIPEPSCWQLATSDGRVVEGSFGQDNDR